VCVVTASQRRCAGASVGAGGRAQVAGHAPC
jgi:hypothetical protein